MDQRALRGTTLTFKGLVRDRIRFPFSTWELYYNIPGISRDLILTVKAHNVISESSAGVGGLNRG